jgi:sugar-phosphatase
MRFRAALLDLDGTLVDSQAAQARAWGAWAEGLGYDPRPFVETLGMTAREKILTFAPSLDVSREVARIVERELAEAADVVALPGAHEVLTGRWPVAIVTSGTRSLALARLKAAELPIPNVLVTADDVRRGKPDPQGYLQAAALLGCPPEMCDVVEDSPIGVAAGIAAAMKVFAVLSTVTAEELGDAHCVVRDVDEYLRRYRR